MNILKMQDQIPLRIILPDKVTESLKSTDILMASTSFLILL